MCWTCSFWACVSLDWLIVSQVLRMLSSRGELWGYQAFLRAPRIQRLYVSTSYLSNPDPHVLTTRICQPYRSESCCRESCVHYIKCRNHSEWSGNPPYVCASRPLSIPSNPSPPKWGLFRKRGPRSFVSPIPAPIKSIRYKGCVLKSYTYPWVMTASTCVLLVLKYNYTCLVNPEEMPDNLST